MTESRVANSDAALWNDASACFDRGDFGRALAILQDLDQRGEHYAATEIGNLFELGGAGVSQDFEKAAKWYRKAVFHLDDPKAHLALARLLLNGQIPFDKDAFHVHASKAAAAGEPLAFLMLGVASELGSCGPPDLEGARGYYEKAAAEGIVLAQRRLAAIAFKSGRRLAGLRMLIGSIVQALSIAKRNRNDPRLTGLPR